MNIQYTDELDFFEDEFDFFEDAATPCWVPTPRSEATPKPVTGAAREAVEVGRNEGAALAQIVEALTTIQGHHNIFEARVAAVPDELSPEVTAILTFIDRELVGVIQEAQQLLASLHRC